VQELKLPGYPVAPASVVVIQGENTYTAADGIFRIDDHQYLVRLDGQGWPCCQDMTADPTLGEPNTFQVSYDYGKLPPIGGVRAAASLACQLALACDPTAVDNGACRLPKRITSITRQGVTLAVLDPLTLFAEGRTGIPEVDLWLESLRYGDAHRRASVLIPGRWQTARRAGQ
jgi:hypothetical protein